MLKQAIANHMRVDEAARRDAAFDIADRSVDLTDRDESHHLIVMDDGEEIGPWRSGEVREEAEVPR